MEVPEFKSRTRYQENQEVRTIVLTSFLFTCMQFACKHYISQAARIHWASDLFPYIHPTQFIPQQAIHLTQAFRKGCSKLHFDIKSIRMIITKDTDD